MTKKEFITVQITFSVFYILLGFLAGYFTAQKADTPIPTFFFTIILLILNTVILIFIKGKTYKKYRDYIKVNIFKESREPLYKK